MFSRNQELIGAQPSLHQAGLDKALADRMEDVRFQDP